MNFLRLNDYLLTILFENEDIIAVDKPYGINSHTNDSKIGNFDFIQDGLIETFERQLSRKLYIVHRLDQTTTGVIIFAKSPESAKKYADYFFEKEVKKTYWFVTASHSAADQFMIDQIIVHKAKDLEAQTKFKVIKKSSKFELWQANPLTGRNHQIRIHAQAAGIPLLGDEKYEGAVYPFLCLHNHRIEFPNGLVITSEVPKYFEDLTLLENQILAKALFETDRRERLFAKVEDNQCFRLVHNKNDFKDLGFTIDQFGKYLILSSYTEDWTESDQKTFFYYANYMQKPIYVRLMHNRGKDAANKSQFTILPTKSEAQTLDTVWVANEKETKYEMRSDSGQSFGLFLDQRLQRSWIRENTKDKLVLNLFSYTCGFSVAAALGGAKEVTSVDTNKNVLNWGRKNFELNAIDTQKHKFLCRDSITFLEQCRSKNIKYDLIICDPPSFSRGEKGVFKIENNLETLLTTCLSCLTDEGDLLFSTNFENFFVDDIRKAILKVQSELKIKNLVIDCIHSALDFELAGKRAILKSFLIRKKL
ncbi:MAG: class I SAM-dependent methyltransferase [Bdellovibrio sp.]|nr:class I SAM-dependent methyltransferase [Bdellovibrio sp.]